ncbi:MAG TPA: double-strand break repair helicase AddA [Bauldia sp.]|nr:double-strand break repair helicase AddA [Bauldia sp.]
MSEIDAATLHAQSQATDPAQSAWVSANAGSGKTFVLARRVVRLLLQGTDPSCILCLTFTKAAASLMAQRVFADLARWTTLDDEALAAEIAAIEGAEPGPRKLTAARRLFARALDTPGGLKIQTIHAFCERLLHQFPFEANVPGHFDVLDERNAAGLMDDARRAVLARAADDPDGPLGRALATVLARVSDRLHEESLAQFVAARDALRAWFVSTDDLDAAIVSLRESLGLDAAETSQRLRRELVDGVPFDDVELLRLIDKLAASSSQDNAAARRLSLFRESSDLATKAEAWTDFFCTERKLRNAFVTNKILGSIPGLEGILAAEAQRLVALVDRIRVADLNEMTAAILRLADGATGEYEQLKMQRGVLDFEDLIVRTATLLARADAGHWVHYKLDRGIQHILVDEAQDTSPRQWQVIASLVEEFFAGEAVSAEHLRTIFAVGDEKQSIFSFQGAVPAWFARMQRALRDKAKRATYAWEDLELHLSFRSVPKILDAVDAVFSAPEVYQGLTAEPRPTAHDARRRNQPGRVVLWPRYDAPPKPETDDWAKPLDHLGDESPEVKIARRIALTVKDWLSRGELLDAQANDGTPRPIRAREILILTRSRGALTDAINRELKKHVPIAGADRIRLTEHIAVMDLMAAARVVLLPEDDLSLAALLKSPLIGIDEQALYDLAYARTGTLWEALNVKAKTDATIAAAKEKIDLWRARADFADPHAFFARMLAADGGRRAFLARLGPEADDVLDEFLAEALAYERVNVPSLEGFIAWLEAGESEVKRDPDTLRDEVRVMTVHGAKGLEADIVFLVDNGTPPVIGSYVDRVVPLADDGDPTRPGPIVWNYSTPAMPDSVLARVKQEQQRDEEEYRRLLYVGMTRARDRLYVVGMQRQKVGKDKTDMRWHPLIERALAGGFTDRTLANGDVEREWRAELAPPPSIAVATTAMSAIALPPWIQAAASPAPPPPVRITPSTVLASPPVVRARRETGATLALERGRLVHRLLQSLPDVAPDRRSEIGARYLDAAAEQWSPGDRAKLLAEVIAITTGPAFAAAFAPGSRAEVEIAGRINGAVISGRADRLAVTPESVLIVDYKTNRPPPPEPPEEYVAQLALYRAVLARLYPDRPVAAALIWTDTPALVVIPEQRLILAESAIFPAAAHAEFARQPGQSGGIA